MTVKNQGYGGPSGAMTWTEAIVPLASSLCQACWGGFHSCGGSGVQPNRARRGVSSANSPGTEPCHLNATSTTTWDQPRVFAMPSQLSMNGSISVAKEASREAGIERTQGIDPEL